jgi:hypothetical protein
MSERLRCVVDRLDLRPGLRVRASSRLAPGGALLSEYD